MNARDGCARDGCVRDDGSARRREGPARCTESGVQNGCGGLEGAAALAEAVACSAQDRGGAMGLGLDSN